MIVIDWWFSMNNLRFFSRKLDVSVFDINRTLVNTYLLLSCTILFSAIFSFLSIKMNVRVINPFFVFLIYFVNLMLIDFFKKSIFGLFLVFVLSGFLGYCSGPLLSSVLNLRNGEELIFFSLLLTSIIFLSLSFYSFFTKKNFNFLESFLFVGFFIILFCFLFFLFFNVKIIQLVLSGFFIIFSSAFILYDLSSIINDGERNYISVTVSLYLSVYNIFISLLTILKEFFYDE
jgi:modulator of FtsH protease